jgi:secreted trypsin-like serine protease
MASFERFLIVLVMVSAVKCEEELWNRLFGSGSKTRPQSQASSNGDSRIVGGETSPEHYPYQISLQMASRGGGGGFFFFQQPRSNWSHFCGGSVLNENHIVTAAHCIQGFNISRMSVFAGSSDLREEERGSRHLIDDCQIHPEYVELNNSDVAVCRLQTPFT